MDLPNGTAEVVGRALFQEITPRAGLGRGLDIGFITAGEKHEFKPCGSGRCRGQGGCHPVGSGNQMLAMEELGARDARTMGGAAERWLRPSVRRGDLPRWTDGGETGQRKVAPVYQARCVGAGGLK